MQILTRTPVRVSFVGGGTDLPIYYLKDQGSVIATSINHFIMVLVQAPSINSLKKYNIKCSHSMQECDQIEDITHPIIREVLKFLKIDVPIKIISFSDVPSGMGMGTSSSFSIGLLHALHSYLGNHVCWEQLTFEAAQIEIIMLNQPIGKQDQTIAAHGGLCQLFFNTDKTIRAELIDCSQRVMKKIEENLMLFSIGKPREAGMVLKAVSQNYSSTKHKLLTELRDLCFPFRIEIENGNNLNRIGEILDVAWGIKRKLNNIISNEAIDKIYFKCRQYGAIGGKLLGAGQSGFLLLYAEKRHQSAIRKAVGFLPELKFSFCAHGSQVLCDKSAKIR